MNNNIKSDPELRIAEKFRLLNNRDDLLLLLNEVAELFPHSIKPGKREIISISVTDLLTSLSEVPYRSNSFYTPAFSKKQFDFFSSSFHTAEKKRKRYTSFQIKKKSGNFREIKAPLPKLKEIQRAINIILQSVYTTQECAFGFVKGKNIVDNAKLHEGAPFVLNMDIKDFFPSIYFRRIIRMLGKEPFNLTGEREQIAYTIANICSEDGYLPQGAPTSPVLTNIICQRLDIRLQQLAMKSNAVYSRYADDITFSSSNYIFTNKFIKRVQDILKDDRFELNDEKTRIQTKSFRQEVTGLTVNKTVNINKTFKRSYRTLVHLYNTKGAGAALEFHKKRMPPSVLEQKFKKEITNTDAYIQNVITGKYNFICMVKGKLAMTQPFGTKSEIKGATIITPLSEATYKIQENLLFAAEPITEYTNAKANDATKSKNEKNHGSKDLIKKVLDEWESSLYNNGFEKSMSLFKKLINGD